jgi:hypothetical protein
MSDTLALPKDFMLNTKQREVAETVFDRNKRREAEINEALKQEHVRREAAVKNMYRLRSLRLARDAKLNNRTQWGGSKIGVARKVNTA